MDLQLLRNRPEELARLLSLKKFPFDLKQLRTFDAAYQDAQKQYDHLRAHQKKASSAFQGAAHKTEGKQRALEQKKLKELSTEVKARATRLTACAKAFTNALEEIPNTPLPEALVGKNAQDNRVIRTWERPSNPHALAHWNLPGFENYLAFEKGAQVATAGFPFYLGSIARLVRALLSFFLKEAHLAGFSEVRAPLLVNAQAAKTSGQLPDKEGQMYLIEKDQLYLIPTAEIPLTSLFAQEIIAEKDLPLKRCGHTPCFRREAGSWGKEVRGLNRLHQFDKVELVAWTTPLASARMLESLVSHGEQLLKELKLPYRVLEICTGDMGFPHAKQYDLEVYALGQKRWLEVSSCSLFTDFQARRGQLRYRTSEGKIAYLHTLNASALAVPRVLAALLENNRQATGEITLPNCLREEMGSSTLKLES